jgi:transposase
MPSKKRKRGDSKPRKKKANNKHLDAFAAGGIAALTKAGYSERETLDANAVFKSDGSPISLSSVGKVLRRLQAEPGWRGERKKGTGETRSTTAEEDAAIVKFVKTTRGKEKVTSKTVQTRLGISSQTSQATIRRRLKEHGLKWLRRRSVFTTKESVEARLVWEARVMKCQESFLRRWVYTDGCSFYLARTAAEMEQSERKSLGPMVYRMQETTDALYKDCTGPSSYKKAQGQCVRIWGLLIDGQLHISVLEKGTVMNRWEYAWLIEHRFEKWLQKKNWPVLVQDHQRCLWCDEPTKAMERIGVQVLDWHPTYSPDLNAIENAWSFLRKRLDETHPCGDEVEDRDAFITRLRAAVSWINKHHHSGMRALCRNQKERAADVKYYEGGRTGW